MKGCQRGNSQDLFQLSGREATLFIVFVAFRLAALYDWRASPLGAREQWPQSLRTAVSLVMSARTPMMLCWGRELTQVYNDAYRSILSTKHPLAFGRGAREFW